jgi:uncharacterized protein (TIGR03067 family)
MKFVGSALSLLVVAGLSLAADKFDPAKLAGKWKFTEGTKAGTKVNETGLAGEVTIDKDKITIKGGDMTHVMEYKLDTTKTPVEITMEGKEGPAMGTKADGIIELDGDTLKLAYTTNIPGFDGKKPTKFESTADNKAFYFVLKRAK